jgi:hypothetical protein
VSPEGSWPWGRTHPWAEIGTWNDHCVLQILSAIDPVSVWVLWRGADRRFDAWYINLQEAFRRVNGRIETQDLELDFDIAPDGSSHTKDEELLDGWIEIGRWSREEVAHIREIGRRVAADLGSGRRWSDERWASWDPPMGWEPWRPE